MAGSVQANDVRSAMVPGADPRNAGELDHALYLALVHKSTACLECSFAFALFTSNDPGSFYAKPYCSGWGSYSLHEW